jgi:hypothetical protein
MVVVLEGNCELLIIVVVVFQTGDFEVEVEARPRGSSCRVVCMDVDDGGWVVCRIVVAFTAGLDVDGSMEELEDNFEGTLVIILVEVKIVFGVVIVELKVVCTLVVEGWDWQLAPSPVQIVDKNASGLSSKTLSVVLISDSAAVVCNPDVEPND